MASIKLTSLSKVSPTKHIMLGRTNDGFLFVIRHLVPITEEYKEWTILRISSKFKLVENLFHVSEQTFEAMMQMYLSDKFGCKIKEISINAD